MTSTLDSLVGELHIVAGARQSTTPATSVATAPRRAARGRADDTLYVLIDLIGSASSGVLAELLQRMQAAYWAMPGSVTSALRAALNAAAEWLMDRNTNAPVPDRLNCGISCAVLRGHEVFLAQAGPTCAYVAQHGKLEHYPLPDSEPITPLGMSRANEIRFARVELEPGDMLALTDARLPNRGPIEAVASAIVSAGVQHALSNLEHLAGTGDLIALVVEAAGATEATPPDRPAAPERSAPRAVATQSIAPQPIREEPSVRSTPAPKIERPVERPVARPQPAAAESSTPREPRRTTTKVWLTALLQSVRRSAGSVGAAGQAVVQRTLPEPTTSRSKPGGRTTRATQPINTPLMAGIAIGVPIIISLMVATVYIQGSSKAELETLTVGAQNEITLAGQTSGAEARAHWQKAIDQANKALEIARDNPTANTQITQAQAAIDRLDNVVRVQPISLWDFKSIGQHHLALQGFSLFVLDRSTNTIDRITLNAAGDGLEGNGPEHILAQGAMINNQVPGNLIDMVWMDSSDKRSTSSLIVLHQTGLIEYNLAFGWKTLDFGTNVVPVNARRLRAFVGNLYVLDPASNQILRYAPKNDGYPDKPENYFEKPPAELPKAVDMAIDGSIYIVTSDGQITKYRGGAPDPFQVNGLLQPLQRISIAAVDPVTTDSSLYIAEQGANRIVQLRSDGKFVRQFRASGPAFDALEDVLIDEQNSRLFVISRGVLYTVALPPIQ